MTPRRVGDRAPKFEHKSIKNTKKEREQQGENSMGGKKERGKTKKDEITGQSITKRKSTFGDR